MTWTLQGKYEGIWEDLTSESTYDEIRDRRAEYEENEPGTPLRVRRERPARRRFEPPPVSSEPADR